MKMTKRMLEKAILSIGCTVEAFDVSKDRITFKTDDLYKDEWGNYDEEQIEMMNNNLDHITSIALEAKPGCNGVAIYAGWGGKEWRFNDNASETVRAHNSSMLDQFGTVQV